MGRSQAIPILLTLPLSLLLLLCSCGGPSSVGNAPQSKSLSQISISPKNPAPAKGTSLQLTATAAYSDGSMSDVTGSVTWQTSNGAIVTVDASGVVSALQVGTASVTATYQSVSSSESITVSSPTLVSIAVSPNPSSLPVGASEQLSAIGTFTDHSTQDLTQSAAWTSSGSSVAAVGPTGFTTAKAIGNVSISAAVGNASGSTSLTVGPPVLMALTVTPSSSSLPLGESVQLTAIGTFTDQSTQDLTQSATWISSGSSVVAVTSTGLATAKTIGNTVISATFGNTSGSASVTASAAALVSIAVNPSSLSLPMGASEYLSAVGTFSDSSTQDLTTSANWSSTAAAVAAVNSNGLATAKSIGNATISASLGKITGAANLAVTPATLVSVAIAPASSSLPIGESEQLRAIGTFTDNSTQDLTQLATWTSSATSVAAVDSTGFASAKAIGNTTVAAAVGNIGTTAQLTVTAAVPVAMNISPNPVSVVLGGSQQLKAIAVYSDGSTQDATSTVQWSSDAENVVSVSAQGLAFAAQVGETTVTASGENLTALAQVTVIPLALTHYFDLATAQTSGLDPTVFITSPGTVEGDLCAMIYVFDQKQEMNECCSCKVSDSGLLVLSLEQDLTANPLTGVKPNTGTIKIVPSSPGSNGLCDSTSIAANGLVLAWGTNARINPNGTPKLVETVFPRVPLSSTESTTLTNLCTAVHTLGGKQGACSCGSGN